MLLRRSCCSDRLTELTDSRFITSNLYRIEIAPLKNCRGWKLSLFQLRFK